MGSNTYIVFRVDGNADLGLGHVMRCLTLANLFKQSGYHVLFICSEESEGSVQYIEKNEFEIKFILNNHTLEHDAGQCREIIKNIDVHLFVVDHYQLDFRWESLVKGSGIRLMVIDDLADRQHLCDVLLDSSYGRRINEYQNLTNNECTYLLGSDYCLLRVEFRFLYEQAILKRKQTRKLANILINFGATDHKQLSVKVVNIIQELKYDGEIHILISSTSKWVKELELISDVFSNIVLHIDAQNVAELMLAADLSIGSVGTSSWERCCLGLPTIGVVVADNQINIASQLTKLGVMELTSIEKIGVKLEDYITKFDLEKWQEMSNKAFQVCDGLGGYRVVNKALNCPPKINLQPMEIEDESILYSWQSEPGNRKYSGVDRVPNIDEHRVWYASSLDSSLRRMWLLIFNGEKCGYVRLDIKNSSEEVSVLISQKYRKLGLAHGAISKLKELCLFGVLDAQISSNNLASILLFKKLGFEKVSNSKYRWNTP